MKTKNNNLLANLICLLLTTSFMWSHAQKCPESQISIAIENVRMPSPKVVEFDVYVTNTGATSLSLAAISGAMDCDKLIPKNTVVSFSPIAGSNTDFPQFNAMKTQYSSEFAQLRWFQSPIALSSGKTADMPIGKKLKFASFRLTSSQELSLDVISKIKPQLASKFGHNVVLATVYCNGNTNSAALRPVMSAQNGMGSSVDFNPIASPNPFTDGFHLNLNNDSENAIQIKVYDMLGKLIETRSIEANEMQNTTIGANYPAGIYNVSVTQGKNSQMIRIIKR